MKAYHVYCNGYSKTLTTIADTQAFIDVLRTRGCVGQEIKIWVGKIDPKFPGAAVYESSKPARCETLTA